MNGQPESDTAQTRRKMSVFESVNYWKMAYTKCACLCVVGLCSTLTTALNGVNFAEYTGTQKFTIYCACANVLASTILAFISTTMSELVKNNPDKSKDSTPL